VELAKRDEKDVFIKNPPSLFKLIISEQDYEVPRVKCVHDDRKQDCYSSVF
jgi:hypothetical protein